MSEPSAAEIQRRRIQRSYYVAAWSLALVIGVGRILNGHFCFQERAPIGDPDRRLDGNNGHTSIDFGGQWMMGRMLASGHGKELYSLPRQWEVAQQAYPRSGQAPTAPKHDAELLIRHFIGKTDRRWADFSGAASFMMASPTTLHFLATATATQTSWQPERAEELTHPKKGPGIGGPLYPPLHAFVMLPFATGDHPQMAYFAMQYAQTLFCFLAGLGVSLLSRGRFWWPLASALILVYPGTRGAIDLGQNSAMTLAVLIWGWVAILRDRPTLGGLVWGLLAFKPVWALSFLCVLLLLRQWRAALAMVMASLMLVLATLPLVGIHSWFHWLAIGQEASRIYNVDANWIPLSRDLLGLPRRFLIDFRRDRDDRESITALVVSWAFWAIVVEITIRVYFLRHGKQVPLSGPFPAMIILAAWLCTYHFMYYDALVSVFGVFVLLTDPHPFFRPRVLTEIAAESTDRPRSRLLVNSFVLSILALMIFHENLMQPLKFEATAVMHYRTTQRDLPNGTTELAPRLIVGTGDHYPWETVMILILWCWCWGRSLTDSSQPIPHEAATRRVSEAER